jgi:peptidoglycan/xylan/chitin deacetylase (PgdA/CDA1 family)
MRGRSAILTYHSLDRSGSVISVMPEVFRRQMQMLEDNGVPVVPLAKIRQSPGAVALTFDDGFGNFLEHAMPVLEQHRFPATVFVVSGHCGRRNDWPGQWRATPRLELMSWSELRAIARRGMEIGAHTAHHPDLTKLPEAEADRELAGCRAAIEQEAGAAVESFAYPYGAVNDAVRRLARRHFARACGTRLEFVQPGSDPAELPRLDAYYLRRLIWFDHLMRPMGRGYLSLRSSLRRVRQCFR